MANDRYRHDRNWPRDDERGRDWGDDRRREDEGYIARRGFGNESAGYDHDRREGRSGSDRSGWSGRSWDDRSGGRERDFGDSAGYGTGGSTRDWRDVMGEDRSRGGRGSDRWRDRGYGGGDRGYGGAYGGYNDTGTYGRDEGNRFGADDFGRGSRGDEDERGFLERAGDEIRSWFGDEDAERRRMRDDREAGYHRGRGPKSYVRSDERIREDVNDRLTDDPHLDASEIEVTVENREVTLSGHVNSRFEKRHAEDLAESVSGVSHVQNNLRVQQPETTGSTGSGTTTRHGTASGAGLNTGAASATGTSGSTTGTGSATRRTSSTSGT